MYIATAHWGTEKDQLRGAGVGMKNTSSPKRTYVRDSGRT
jgi:hypothetical protein